MSNTAFEILVPTGAELHEAPRLVGRMLPILANLPEDVCTIEYFDGTGRVESDAADLRAMLLSVVASGQIMQLFLQCFATMYPPREQGTIGQLSCLQGGKLITFSVHEHAALPNLKWELRRRVKAVDVAPYQPEDAFKPRPRH